MKRVLVAVAACLTFVPAVVLANIDRAGNAIDQDEPSAPISWLAVIAFAGLYALVLPQVKKHVGDDSIGYYITAAIAAVGLFIVGALLRL